MRELKDNDFLITYSRTQNASVSWQKLILNLAFVHFPLRCDWRAQCVKGSNEMEHQATKKISNDIDEQ